MCPVLGPPPPAPPRHAITSPRVLHRQRHRAPGAAPSQHAAAEATPTEDPYYAPSAEFTVAEGIRDVGMVFVGASMTAGYGDPKGLGWVGRVVARTQHPDLDLTAYNLGVRGNTSG